jgi:hypothetical protein
MKSKNNPSSHILYKGGIFMAIWWITTFGFLLCLGFVGGIIMYSLKGALDPHDASRIDPLPKDNP